MLLPCPVSTTTSPLLSPSQHKHVGWAIWETIMNELLEKRFNDQPQELCISAQAMRLHHGMVSTCAPPKAGFEYLVNIEQLETGQKTGVLLVSTFRPQPASIADKSSLSLLCSWPSPTLPELHRSTPVSLSLKLITRSVRVCIVSARITVEPTWQLAVPRRMISEILGLYICRSAEITTSFFTQVLGHCSSHAKDLQLLTSAAITSEGIPGHEAL
jgi:hypothetical protein